MAPGWRRSLECEKSAEAPEPTTVPDTLHDIDFMVKDSRRFANSGGWGYAQFQLSGASDTFAPEGTAAMRLHVPHDREDEGLCFTAYPKR